MKKGKETLKHFKSIWLGICCLGCGFALGFFLGDYEQANEPVIYEKTDWNESEYATVSNTSERINENTKFVIQKKRLNDGSIWRDEEKMPEAFWGMERGEFLCALQEEGTLKLPQKFVLQDLSLVSFSKDKVLVEETFMEPELETDYYLTVYDNRLVVLFADRETVYMETGIMIEQVPDEMQRSIMEGYQVTSEQELFEMLEALTS